jgi:hypothetical protein
MNAFATGPEISAALLDASSALVLIVKWTVALALAWLAHGLLARQNPRWRVALWRTTLVGLALVAMLSGVPPIVTYRLVPRDPPGINAVPTVPTAPAVPVRVAPGADTVQARPGIPPGADPGLPRLDFPARAAAVGAGKLPGVPAMPGRSDPAARKAQGSRWGVGIVSSWWTIWLAGVLVLAARLVVGSWSLARRDRPGMPGNRSAAGMSGAGPGVLDEGHRDTLSGWALASRAAVARAGV